MLFRSFARKQSHGYSIKFGIDLISTVINKSEKAEAHVLESSIATLSGFPCVWFTTKVAHINHRIVSKLGRVQEFSLFVLFDHSPEPAIYGTKQQFAPQVD